MLKILTHWPQGDLNTPGLLFFPGATLGTHGVLFYTDDSGNSNVPNSFPGHSQGFDLSPLMPVGQYIKNSDSL